MIFRFMTTSLVLLLVTLHLKESSAIPKKGRVLFVGDSDIEYWKKITDKKYPTSKNRGIAGSTCKKWVNNIDKWLIKDKPSTVVLVCGENDLAYGESPEDAFSNFKKIVEKISAKGVPTIYFGTKPEPDTKGLHKKYQKYDALIRDFYVGESTGENSPPSFIMIDVYPSFVELKNPRSFYRNDKLHLSNKGYGYWNDWLDLALNNINCRRWESGKCNPDPVDIDPTPAPTDSESTFEPICADDPDFLYNFKRYKKPKNCNWVGKRNKWRKWCNKRAYKGYYVKQLCPQACGEC